LNHADHDPAPLIVRRRGSTHQIGGSRLSR
jgi:hypothetical protein